MSAFLSMNPHHNAARMVRKIDKELMSSIITCISEKEKTGYEVYKELKNKGINVSSRLVYHYLYVALKEGKIDVEQKNELGNFSWGNTVNKKYYRIK